MLNTIKVSVVFDRKHVATKPTAKRPVKGLVQLSVTINGERRFYSTGVKVYQGQFTAEQVVIHPDAQQLNDIIGHHSRAIIERVNKCNADGHIFSWSMLDGLKVRTGNGTRFTDWMEYQIRTRQLAAGTKAHQLTVLEFLREQKVTDFSHLNYESIMSMDKVLHERVVNGHRLHQTSIYGYHKVIRCYINLAICAGLMDRTPYSRIKIEKGESEPRDVLTMDEIHSIEQLQPQSLYLKHVRDLFLLQIWTGLSYADLMAADFMQIKDNTLSGFRVKTGQQYITTILPQARQILEGYGYKVPHMSDAAYRRMLTCMMETLGITKKISTHNGRHTFATTVMLGHGVPIEMVSKMLGHKSIKTTQIYARVQQPMIQEQAERLSKLAL